MLHALSKLLGILVEQHLDDRIPERLILFLRKVLDEVRQLMAQRLSRQGSYELAVTARALQ